MTDGPVDDDAVASGPGAAGAEPPVVVDRDGIARRLAQVRERIASAADRAGRDPSTVTLVAVGKGHPAEALRTVVELGVRDLGENRPQELVGKATALADMDVRWHLVGHLQRNKVRHVRPLVHLLHSLDRERLAVAWLKGPGRPPPVLVEVNIGREPQKHGVDPDEAAALVDRCVDLGLDVQGLMAIPPLSDDPEASRPWFRRLATLRDEIARRHPSVRHLSMGMSADLEPAIEEGATFIRVGRAIFGPRTTPTR